MGVVVSKPIVSSSYLARARRVVESDEERLAGASIRLFIDLGLTQEVKKSAATTGASGEYEIITHDLPATKDPDGYYYLVVEKEGFAKLTQRITIGSFSPYREHTVYLHRIK
jgi:hypothetical protein